MNACMAEPWLCLLSLGALRGRGHQLSTKYPVPEPTGDTKPVLEIGKVVLEVIFFEPLIVCGETGAMLDCAAGWARGEGLHTRGGAGNNE